MLSFDQAPPLAAPLRFFLTAPLFGALAGGLLLIQGPEVLASRWMPGTLALTHLLTLGFMLQVMLGALLQILPVVTGATVKHPLALARGVHGAVTLGVGLLAAAFLSFKPMLFQWAMFLLGGGALLFLGAVISALGRRHMGSSEGGDTPTNWALKLALLGLGGTVFLGALLAASLGWQFALPLNLTTNIHLTWGLVGWGVLLLSGVAYVVVPMFLLTPPFPLWLTRVLAPWTFLLLALWSGAEAAGWGYADILAIGLVLACGGFALVALVLLVRSKRARLDATQGYWRLGLVSGLAAALLWLLGKWLPGLAGWDGQPLVFGILLLVGGFMSVISGMLYKIVPFLFWLHLQNAGQGRVVAPNMKKILAESRMLRQMFAHALALALLLGAVFWPRGLIYPAGLALLLDSLWLGWNLLAGLKVYRSHLAHIRQRLIELS